MLKLSKTYNPKETEERIYNLWQKGDYFKPKGKGKKYVITIPPPNITGSLHMGHALNNTLQDVLIRQARMKGYRTLWLPGTDHAGIATQNVVEKELKKEGKTRQQLGREKFLQKVWQWKKKYGNTIIDQLKKLGCSCDWSRQRFTMDPGYSKAVEQAFKHYYKKGYIYQGVRVISWCPRCQTSLSDLEVEYKEQKGKLYYFKYDKNFPLAIATTRPETKLGDTAVAVNLNDKRYQKYVGKTFKVNFAGLKRKIKIIADKSIDPKFGTGALGVTPAHSIVDFEMAEKNNLPLIKVIDENGRMTKEAGKNYQGLKTKEAADKLIDYLKKNKLLQKEEEIINNLSICYRCQTPLEPQPSKQWFVKMGQLAKPAIEVVKQGKIKFYPSQWKKVYLDWLENIRDWCISRQIWWGHKIPIKGENDVLDTWFSSALWPFAILGWPLDCAQGKPKKGSDLEQFFPTTVLVTDRGIINLWVARMVFSSLEFMKKIPFSEVYINPTVFNKEGKRMSKSLGTGIDPLDLIDKYGTDATRFGLAYQTTGSQDIKFSEEVMLAAKKFANKIWNASRFVLTNLTRIDADSNADLRGKTAADRAILERLNSTIKSVDKDLDKYRFGQVAHTLYEFFWHDFCDKYLEESKKQLNDKRYAISTKQILLYTLVSSLKLLHPFMPFITEEIYQNMLHTAGYRLQDKSIMISNWPK